MIKKKIKVVYQQLSISDFMMIVLFMIIVKKSSIIKDNYDDSIVRVGLKKSLQDGECRLK